MTLNPNVNVDTETSRYADIFTPDEGYALWDDTEEGNLDENGNPIIYNLQRRVPKTQSEAQAPHIWARLIDDTMEVYGLPPGFVAAPVPMSETEEKAAAYDVMMGTAE